MNVDWLFFDVGGPLVHDSRIVEQNVMIDLRVLQQYLPDITRQDIVDARPKASGMLGKIEENLVHMFLKDKVLADKAYQEIEQEKAGLPSYLDSVIVRKEAADICGQLSKRYKLGLIANQHSGVKELLSSAGILQHFTHQKVSHDYGLIKPDPEYYRAVLKDTGADPLRSVMIDDNIERSLMPAKKFGMKTVWYKLEDRAGDPTVIDYTILKLEDLLSIF